MPYLKAEAEDFRSLNVPQLREWSLNKIVNTWNVIIIGPRVKLKLGGILKENSLPLSPSTLHP